MYYYTLTRFDCVQIGYPWNDQISSLRNQYNTEVAMHFIYNPTCTAIGDKFYYGFGDHDMWWYNNDKFSAIMLL